MDRRAVWFVAVLALAACKGTEPFVPVPTTVLVTPGSASLASIGATQQFGAVVQDQRGDPISGAAVSWTTGNTAVATIDNSGLLTAIGAGSTQVTALVPQSSPPLSGSAAITVTQVPRQMVKVTGDQQTDTAGQTLPVPVVVRVNDLLAHPIPGVRVGFAVTQGGGSASAVADTTDAAGLASVAWTLGSTSGPNTLAVTVATAGVAGNPATFTADGVVPGGNPTVVRFAGDAQVGLAGFAVNVPPAVQVRDALNQPVVGMAVSFAVTGGGGSVLGAAAVTDANGVARVGAWTLTLGPNQLTATVQGAVVIGNPVTFTATGDSARYHIDVRFLVPTTPSRQAAFTNAAAKWETLIFGDVEDVTVAPSDVPAGSCGANSPALSETIDDIIIFATIDSIDGPGKILGRAGPCFIRDGNLLPVIGTMQFDSADVAMLENNNLLDLVIEHEMGHVLGYGTIWDLLGLLVGANTPDSHFIGVQALAAFDRVGGQTFTTGSKVPVENCVGIPKNNCGPGTQDSHWRESVFNNELMTGYLDAGTNPLSVVSTASMGDLGYRVNYAGSDSYVLSLALRAAEPTITFPLGDDVLRMPIYAVDARGRVVRVIAPR